MSVAQTQEIWECGCHPFSVLGKNSREFLHSGTFTLNFQFSNKSFAFWPNLAHEHTIQHVTECFLSLSNYSGRFSCGSAGDTIQDLTHTKQVLYHRATSQPKSSPSTQSDHPDSGTHFLILYKDTEHSINSS